MTSLSNAVYYYGFASEDVVLFEPPMLAAEARDFEDRDREKGRLTRRTVEELNGRPDVVAAAVMYRVPLTRPNNHSGWEELQSIGGVPARRGSQVNTATVGREFAPALGVSLVQGQTFDDPQNVGRHNLALVNSTFDECLLAAWPSAARWCFPVVSLAVGLRRRGSRARWLAW